MAEKNYLKTEAVFLTEKTPKKEVVVTPPLREDSLTITENGTYQAPIGRGYTDVEVNVQELPEVTSEDNGKVLGVVDGTWAKMVSGELPVVKTIKTDGEHYYGIQFDDVDYIAEEKLFWINDASAVGYDYYYLLCIPQIQHTITTSAKLTLINQGLIYTCTATKSQSNDVWMFSFDGINIELSDAPSQYIEQTFGSYQEGYIQVLTDPTRMISTWMSPQGWWNEAGIQIDIANVTDMTDVETTLNQAISGMKTLAGASPETTVAKYMTLPTAYQYAMLSLISRWNTSLTENKNPVYIAFNSGTFVVTDVRYTAQLNESFATAVYKEIDFTNNKIYDMKITFNQQKLFFECTCHEATSLA